MPRQALAEALGRQSHDLDNWHAIARYLLLRKPQGFHDQAAQLFYPSRDAKAAPAVVRKLLDATGESWRVLEDQAAQLDSMDFNLRNLGIEAISHTTVRNLLLSGWVNRRLPLSITDAEYDYILSITPPDAWARDLVIHKTLAGTRVSAARAIGLATRVIDVVPDGSLLLDPSRLVVEHSDKGFQLQQDRLGLKRVDATRLLDLALRHESPAQHWRVVLTLLKDRQPRAELLDQLRTVPWLPTSSGVVAPRQLLHLPEIEQFVQIGLGTGHHDWVSSTELIEDLRQPDSLKVLVESRVLDRRNMLARLLKQLAEDPHFRIGLLHSAHVDGAEAALLPRNWVSTFRSDSKRFPAADLFARLHDDELAEAWQALLGTVPPARLYEHLEHLSERRKKPVEDIRDLYFLYLSAARDQDPDWLRHPGLKLLTKNGQWSEPKQLTLGQLGVAASHTLDEQQSELVRKAAATITSRKRPALAQGGTPESVPPGDVAECFANLWQYFRTWPTELERHIGALVALMGGHQLVRGYSRRLLGGDSGIPRDVVLERLAPNHLRGTASDFRQSVDNYRFALRIEEEGAFDAINLLDESITVPAESGHDSLIVGSIERIPASPQDHLSIRFIVNSERDPRAQKALLKNTAKYLLEEVYGWPSDGVASAFDWLDDRDHFPLEVAQENFLDAAFPYLRNQLGAKSNSLSTLFKRWEMARSDATAARLSGSEGLHQAEDNLNRIRLELKTLVETDEEAQQTILAAVRRKLRESQYQVGSIPFELLQNADDAVLELREFGDLEPQSHTRFLVVVTPGCLDLMHWGRRINYGLHKLGFHLDLERMLTLGASDKASFESEQGNTNPTGKFGLGFKSTVLLADRPKVISGDLAFEVVGGTYPMPIPRASDKYGHMTEALGNWGNTSDGTLIRLEGEHEEIATAVDRFLDLGAHLLLFTCEIQQLDIQVSGTTRLSSRRIRRPASFPNVEVVELQEQKPLFRVAMINGNGNLKLAVGLGENGFVGLRDGVPDIWVTMPIQDPGKRKLALNGAFAVDIGRAQLARDSRFNRQLAREFAPVLFEAFQGMFQTWQTDPMSVDRELGFSRSLGRALWDSLFDVLTHEVHHPSQGDATDEVIWEALWSSSGGARRFITECAALPTRLRPPYDSPLRLDDVGFVVPRLLDRSGAFAAFAESDSFRKAFPIGQTVSKEVHDLLRQVGIDTKAKEITLMRGIEAALGQSPKATTEVLNLLRVLRDSSVLDSKQLSEVESRSARALLGRVKFLNQASPAEFVDASSLLAKEDDGDGCAIVEFAPRSLLLADSYDDQQVELFLWCRGSVTVATETLTEWVKRAETDDARSAAAKFLTTSSAGHSVAFNLMEEGQGTWLETAPGQLGLDAPAQAKLGKLFGSQHHGEPDPTGTGVVHAVRPGPLIETNASRLFSSVAQLWARESSSLVKTYEAKTFPWPLDLRRDFDPDDRGQRRDWLTLLLLAGTYRLGRTTSEQNRDFLRKCRDQGWMDKFIHVGHIDAPGIERSAAWASVIDEFLEVTDSGEYFHWWSIFITIYQVSTWLDDYVELLLNLERASSDKEIRGAWRPRSSSAYSGSGIDVPSLERALKTGRPFVIRELLRRGVLSNPRLRAYAYFMSGPTKTSLARVVGAMPDDRMEASKMLHQKLSDALGDGADFMNCYDLPFTLGLHEAR